MLAIGAAELIEEVSQGKITGEEDRYSKTDLWDFNANLEGSQALITLLTPALEEADPNLLARINAGFAELNETLATFRDGDGWVLYCQENDDYPSSLCSGTTVSQGTVDLLILPEGGGFFFTLPGVPGEGRFLADGLFARA